MTASGKGSRTHLEIDERLCGSVRELGPGRAVVEWTAGPETAADSFGLVHGGFVFGVADYAAMLAVNEPNVVLASAECRFLAPVRTGACVVAEAEIVEPSAPRCAVDVEVSCEGRAVMTASFRCVVTERHVLEVQG